MKKTISNKYLVLPSIIPKTSRSDCLLRFLFGPPTRRGPSPSVKISRNHNAGDVSVSAVIAILSGEALNHISEKRSKCLISLLRVFDQLLPGLLFERNN